MQAKERKLDSLAKVVRVMTVAPLMALVLLSAAYISGPQSFGGIHNYLFSVLFLCVLPVLAYPLQPIVPGFKDKGREGQRSLAIVMAVVGYVGGVVTAVLVKAPAMVLTVFLTYLFSGVGIVLFNKVIKVRASGHACGVAGPAALCGAVLSGPGAIAAGIAIGLALLALVFWASLRMKRHTLSQLIHGSLIPIVSFGLAWLVCSFL